MAARCRTPTPVFHGPPVDRGLRARAAARSGGLVAGAEVRLRRSPSDAYRTLQVPPYSRRRLRPVLVRKSLAIRGDSHGVLVPKRAVALGSSLFRVTHRWRRNDVHPRAGKGRAHPRSSRRGSAARSTTSPSACGRSGLSRAQVSRAEWFSFDEGPRPRRESWCYRPRQSNSSG
jgi:hypothetical protein